MRLQNLRAHLDILNDTLCFNKIPHIPDGASGKEAPLPKKETQEMWVGKIPWGWEDSLELEMATHSSILVWEIPMTEKPSRLQFMGVSKELDTTEHTST